MNVMDLLSVYVLAYLALYGISRTTAIRVAVIGGGISGTSTAYFLNQIFGEKVSVDVYEGGNIGGRLSTIKIGKCEYETGGAVMHEKNKYASELAAKMGLPKTPDPSNSVLGLYDNDEFLFIGSKYFMINAIKMLWRYGTDIFSLQKFTSLQLSHFDRIYELQDKNVSFSHLNDLMSAIHPMFLEYMTVSTYQGFIDDGYSPRIIDELIQATLKCNYGQTASVHRFVGLVSVAGAGSELFSLNGGNKMLPYNLLKASKCNLIQEYVQSITLSSSFPTSFAVKTTNDSRKYDFVVLSTSLTRDEKRQHSIAFHGFPVEIAVPGEYWTTICTIVKGRINPKYFGFITVDEVPDLVINVAEDSLFNSIGKISPVQVDASGDEECSGVWKIFSKRILKPEHLSVLFDTIIFKEEIDWLAYPHYGTDNRSYNFTLHDNLFYSNAMEWTASAIETGIIGARNVALLIQEQLKSKGTEPLEDMSSFARFHDDL